MSEVITTHADPLFRRTLRLAVAVAAQLQFPKKVLRGGHTVGEGYYYRCVKEAFSSDEVKMIEKKVAELIEHGEPIIRASLPYKAAVSYFEENNLVCAKTLLETRVTEKVDCYQCRGVTRLALHQVHETMASLKTGRQAKFALIPAAPGFIVTYASDEYIPQPVLLEAHRDHVAFSEASGTECVGKLNMLQQVGRTRKDYVLQCEFRQEGKLSSIAQKVLDRQKAGKPVKLVCIAGPTSSGKTTFSNKLCMYLQNLGFPAKPLTVDHYYLPLDRQPKYKIRQQVTDVDFDHIESMDVELVGDHLNRLTRGESVMTPIYNMKTGYREGTGHLFEALPPNGVLVIEGIHALNPLYTDAVDKDMVFKIFISPLTGLQLDDTNTIKTTDHRLVRRMCRDYLFRGRNASSTLKQWDGVRRGEGVWIFPHQNKVDFVMNSAAEYEIPVLKTFVEPLLRVVSPEDPNYAKAKELLQMFDKVGTWPPGITPDASLLREFIGDGVFDCH